MKPDLVILHGGLGCAAQFTGWAGRLSEYFTCHLPELSGHGEKSADAAEFDIVKFSADLQLYIRENNLRQPGVLGYSMGGYVALCSALKKPDLLGKIMTIATKFDWNPEAARREAGYLKPALMWEKVPQLVEQLRGRHGAHWEAVVEKTANMMLALGEAPLLTTSCIGEIKNQLKFCVGDKDKMVSVQETYDIYKAAGKNASLCILPDTGHLPETMRVDKIIFEVREFFLGHTEPK